MAKRKTPKVKDVIDITPKPEKITEDQLKDLQGTVNTMHRIQMDIGITESRKHDLLHNLTVVRDRVTVMQGDFEKEYGTYDINMQDGTINYKKDVEADKKD